MKEWNLIDYNIKNKLPKEDCKIWITRTCFDGSRWVQYVDFYVDDERIIMWDGTIAWMLDDDDDERPKPYEGDYSYVIQDVR